MDRRNLRANYIAAHGEEAARNKQAHHVIPVEILKELYGCDEADLPETFNEEWNCLMLPTDASQEFVHWGSHPWYTNFIRWQINNISQGNITEDTLKTVATVIRTFCEENMEPFLEMKLNGTINNIEDYAKIVEFAYEQ